MLGFVDHFALTVKAQYVIAHTACPAWLHLMLVSEEPLSGKAATIVQFSMGEYTQQCALASIHIAHHCHSGDMNMKLHVRTTVLYLYDLTCIELDHYSQKYSSMQKVSMKLSG